MKRFPILLLLLIAASPLTAQQTELEQSSGLLVVPAGDKFLRWHGHIGRSYFVQASDTNNPLAEWSWVPVIEAGNDEEISYEVDGTSSRGFFRLKYTTQPIPEGYTLDTADFDGDSLSNIDEIDPQLPLLASAATDPLNPDTDGDGMNDGWEVQHGFNPTQPSEPTLDADNDGLTNLQEYQYGTNPNNADSDGDGLTDGEEVTDGTDPTESTVIGPVNLGFDEEITDSPDMSFRDANPADLYDQSSIPGWQAAEGQHIEVWDEGDGNPYVELQSHLDAHGVKQEFSMRPGSRLNFILRCKGRYEGWEACDNAFTLKVEGASELLVDGNASEVTGNVRSKSFMETDSGTQWQTWHYASVSITAPPGASGLKQVTLSLIPITTTSSGEEITRGGFVDLLPVEIVNYEKKPVSELVVADMEESLNQHGALIIDDGVATGFSGDPDRFCVRIPNMVGNFNVTVKLSTVENPDSSYNDDPTELKLYPVDGGYESKSQVLVSGAVDAEIQTLENITLENPEPLSRHKRTHNVQLGGKVRITDLIIDGTALAMDIKIPVPVKKTVNLNMVVMTDAGTPDIVAEVKSANEIFASTGIKILWSGTAASKAPPAKTAENQQAESIVVVNDAADFGRFITHCGTPGNDDIHVMYVLNCWRSRPPQGEPGEPAQGFAIAEMAAGPNPSVTAAPLSSTNNLFISKRHAGFCTLAHELAHLLTNSGHYGGSAPHDYEEGADDVKSSHNLMNYEGRNSSETDKITAKKRIYEKQRKMMLTPSPHRSLINP